MKIGYVCALRRELQTLAVLRGPETTFPHPLLALSGMGGERAAGAAGRLADQGADCLVSWGFAGALDPELAPGHLVIPECVVTGEGASYPAEPELRGRVLALAVRPASGLLFCADRLVAGVPDKRTLATSSGAVAVDMESAAVARVARHRGLGFLAVRAIVDPAGLSLPLPVTSGVDEFGEIRRAAFCGALLKQPGALGTLVLLAGYMRRARSSLERLAKAMRVSDVRVGRH